MAEGSAAPGMFLVSGIPFEGNDRMGGVGIFFLMSFLRLCRLLVSWAVVGKQMLPFKASVHLKRGMFCVAYSVYGVCGALPVFDNEKIDD